MFRNCNEIVALRIKHVDKKLTDTTLTLYNMYNNIVGAVLIMDAKACIAYGRTNLLRTSWNQYRLWGFWCLQMIHVYSVIFCF